LLAPPDKRTARNGNPFYTATLWADDEYWNLVVFNELAQAELMRLRPGESLSVQGRLQVSLYEKKGVQKISRSIVVEHAFALRPRQSPKRGAPPMQSGLFDGADNFADAWAGPR